MKATGIVRRIDDLGRIVIPKEIRRTMRIREGDPMEIFTSREGEILLKKYSPVGELGEFATGLAESIAQTLGELVCVTDRDYVIAVAGAGKKEFEGRMLDEQMQQAIDQRTNQVLSGEKSKFIKITQEDEKGYERQAIATILSHGDCIGSVIILSREKNNNAEEALLQIAKTVATFLGKHMEQ
ncbi:MAG: AbrB/MazE/SpoVT family DNA-binding domain-containing protein [Agathobacter sp.]|nr:AbrB/MazE/SpoVT family DNA-binding domain-containing protein [Agathobacter sp.]